MRKPVKVLIIVAAVILVLAAVLLILAPERRPLTDRAREKSGRDFIELSEGWTEYDIAGPADGEPVILIPGATVPMFDWDAQFDVFAEAGNRVLRYNQYARGMSDRPRGAYDSGRYVRQVADLMDSQGWDSAHLVVHSMGGAVAVDFAAAHPERVDRMVLISPAWHLADDHGGIAAARIPVIGDIAVKAALTGVIAERSEGLFRVSGLPESTVVSYNGQFKDQTRYWGFTRAVKSLFRNDVVDLKKDAYEQIDGSRTMLIWGTEDGSIPRAHIDRIIETVPGLDVQILEGAHHSPNMEVPDKVNELVLDFLAG